MVFFVVVVLAVLVLLYFRTHICRYLRVRRPKRDNCERTG